MRRRAFVAVLLGLPALARAQAPATVTELYTMEVGQSVTRPGHDVQMYSSSGPGLVDLRTSDTGEIVFTGRAPGQTMILLVRTDGTQVRCLCTVLPASS